MAAQALDTIEGMYATIGLSTPISRFVVTTLAVGGLIYYFKPSYFYIGDQAKGWSLTSADDGRFTSIPVTWWMVALGAGVFGGAVI